MFESSYLISDFIYPTVFTSIIFIFILIAIYGTNKYYNRSSLQSYLVILISVLALILLFGAVNNVTFKEILLHKIEKKSISIIRISEIVDSLTQYSTICASGIVIFWSFIMLRGLRLSKKLLSQISFSFLGTFILSIVYLLIFYEVNIKFQFSGARLTFDQEFAITHFFTVCSEELLKVIGAIVVISFIQEKNRLNIGIIAGFSALGFSFLENILYFNYNYFNDIVLLRCYQSTMLHLFCTSLIVLNIYSRSNLGLKVLFIIVAISFHYVNNLFFLGIITSNFTFPIMIFLYLFSLSSFSNFFKRRRNVYKSGYYLAIIFSMTMLMYGLNLISTLKHSASTSYIVTSYVIDSYNYFLAAAVISMVLILPGRKNRLKIT